MYVRSDTSNSRFASKFLPSLLLTKFLLALEIPEGVDRRCRRARRQENQQKHMSQALQRHRHASIPPSSGHAGKKKQCVWEGVWKSEGGLRWNSKVCRAPKITARPSYPTLEFSALYAHPRGLRHAGGSKHERGSQARENIEHRRRGGMWDE